MALSCVTTWTCVGFRLGLLGSIARASPGRPGHLLSTLSSLGTRRLGCRLLFGLGGPRNLINRRLRGLLIVGLLLFVVAIIDHWRALLRRFGAILTALCRCHVAGAILTVSRVVFIVCALLLGWWLGAGRRTAERTTAVGGVLRHVDVVDRGIASHIPGQGAGPRHSLSRIYR